MSALGGVLLPLLDNHRLEILALGHLALDVCDDGLEVWYVLSGCQSPGLPALRDSLTSSGLVHSSLGRSWWDMESCRMLAGRPTIPTSGPDVPGKLGAGGRHGRRLPGVGDASERSERRRSPRGASHRPCTTNPVSPSIRTLQHPP